MVAMTILGTISLLLLFWAVGAYKRLSSLRAQCRRAYAMLDAQLKTRHALIPMIVERAAGRMEREALDPVNAAREEAVAASGKNAARLTNAIIMQSIAQAENALATALGRMMAGAEAHADLKADETMLGLRDALSRAEKDITFSWQFYNIAATQYNLSRAQFPVSVIAAVFAFRAEALLHMAGEHEAPGLAV
jgi:LemA protein